MVNKRNGPDFGASIRRGGRVLMMQPNGESHDTSLLHGTSGVLRLPLRPVLWGLNDGFNAAVLELEETMPLKTHFEFECPRCHVIAPVYIGVPGIERCTAGVCNSCPQCGGSWYWRWNEVKGKNDVLQCKCARERDSGTKAKGP